MISVVSGVLGYQINFSQSHNTFEALEVGMLVAVGVYLGIKIYPSLQKVEDYLASKIESLLKQN